MRPMKTSDRVVALFAPEQTTFTSGRSTASPDPCGVGGAAVRFGNPVPNSGDRRQCDHYADRAFKDSCVSTATARRGSRAAHPTQLYRALCFMW